MVYLMPAENCDCKTCNGGTPAPEGVFGGTHCTCPCHSGGGDQNNPSPFDKIFEQVKGMEPEPSPLNPQEHELSSNGSCKKCGKGWIDVKANPYCYPQVSEIEELDQDCLSLAMDVCQKLWDERKISYKWDNILDVEFLAYVIQHKKLPK